MKGHFLSFIFGLVCALLAFGLIQLAAGQPAGRPVQLMPPPTPLPLTVHVSGAVARPGVYVLPPGSRVQDALQAAGGASTGANMGELNLAAPLKDGQQVLVAAPGATPSPAPSRAAALAPTRRATLAPTHPAGKINLNTASAQELEALPGIGPSLAHSIVQYRQLHGEYKKIEDILNVPGIGPKTFERIRALIEV